MSYQGKGAKIIGTGRSDFPSQSIYRSNEREKDIVQLPVIIGR